MRPNWRNFIMIGAGIIVIAVLVLITNLQQQSTDTTTPTTVATTLFSGVNITDVARLSITDEATATTNVYVQAEDGSWQLEGGGVALAQQTIDSTIGNLIQVKAESFPAEDLTAFQLDAPTLTVVFTTKDGKAQTLRVGKPNPQGNGYYALLNDDNATVHMLSGVGTMTQLTTLATTPPLAATPTPAVTTLTMPGAIFGAVAMQNVSSIEFRNTTSNDYILFQKDAAGSWSIAGGSKVNSAAGGPEINLLVNALASLSGVDGFESDDLATYGLDKPLYTFTLNMTGGDPVKLDVGSTERNGTRTNIKLSNYSTIVVVRTEDLQPFIDAVDNPPFLAAESTAEATIEATADATSEATADATEAAEPTAEATADSD